jgi:hypothetical protein
MEVPASHVGWRADIVLHTVTKMPRRPLRQRNGNVSSADSDVNLEGPAHRETYPISREGLGGTSRAPVSVLFEQHTASMLPEGLPFVLFTKRRTSRSGGAGQAGVALQHMKSSY